MRDRYVVGQQIILTRNENIQSERADDFKFVWKRIFMEDGVVKEEVVSNTNTLTPVYTDDYSVSITSVYNGDESEAVVHSFSVGVPSIQ